MINCVRFESCMDETLCCVLSVGSAMAITYVGMLKNGAAVLYEDQRSMFAYPDPIMFRVNQCL